MSNNIKLQLLGWVLFVLSAVFFIASSAKAGDPISLTGGIIFFISCFIFIYALLKESKSK